jgi:hypothetical protein
MSLQQQLAANDIEWRRDEYEDSVEFVSDLGPQGQTAVDVVDNTVIVVAGGEQYEFDAELGADARAFINNGVLTIEVDR